MIVASPLVAVGDVVKVYDAGVVNPCCVSEQLEVKDANCEANSASYPKGELSWTCCTPRLQSEQSWAV